MSKIRITCQQIVAEFEKENGCRYYKFYSGNAKVSRNSADSPAYAIEFARASEQFDKDINGRQFITIFEDRKMHHASCAIPTKCISKVAFSLDPDPMSFVVLCTVNCTFKWDDGEDLDAGELALYASKA